MNIAGWKIKDIARDCNGGFCEEILGVERETEKAVLLQIRWAYTSSLERVIKVWIPKSAILSDEQVAELDRQAEARFEAGKNRYEALIKFAKEHGVKGVRVGMKATTILNKLNENGLAYNY